MKLKTLLYLVTTMLAASMNLLAAEWEKPVPPIITVENGQNYYLYNSSVEQFINTQDVVAALTDNGSPVTFSIKSGEDWMLKGTKGYLYTDIDFIGCAGGASDSNTAWYVEKHATGTYHFRPSKSDSDYSWEEFPDMWMGVAEYGGLRPLLKANEGSIDWYLVAANDYGTFLSKLALHHAMVELQANGVDVSALLEVYNNPAAGKAEYDAALESVKEQLFNIHLKNATEENPFDVTSAYLRNADLAENWVDGGHDVPGWTMVPANFCGMGESDIHGFYDDDKVLGSWAAGAFGDNKLYQEMVNLPVGKYKLSNYGLWIRHTGEEGDPLKGAYIYAKVGDKMFREPLPDTGWWRGLSEVTFETRCGEAEVGIMFEGTNVGQCVILDFKLEYMGDPPVGQRLSTLITNSQELIANGGVYAPYLDKLNADIAQANELLAGDDDEKQEMLFAVFLDDYETAVKNKEYYVELTKLLQECLSTLIKGESEAIDELADYIYENDIEYNITACAYDNTQIEEIMGKLAELNEKARNSIISEGADVTDLLVNGHFDGTGGWVPTLNDFSIDTGKKILERWWCDWKAEQVVENVPNGTYRLEVQGFQWCSWDWGLAESDWNSGDGTPTYKVTSKVRLNDSETLVYNVFACGKTDIKAGYLAGDYYVPNDANSAIKFFDLGLYNNVVEATVTDHKLKVEFDCSSNGFWNCFKNLRLYYVGADMDEAIANLKNAIALADELLENKMQGSIRKALEDAKAVGEALIGASDSKFDDINDAITNILALQAPATESIKEYVRLAIALAQAEETLADPKAAATEAGKQLRALYDTTMADYQSDYPSLDSEGVAATVKQLEELMAEAKIGGIKAGDDITNLIANPSFENTYGNDISVGNAAHTVPYGWTMRIDGKDCHSAQELADAGINSWTAIEDNAYATDGTHSYCLLSAPVPDAYLYQCVTGLPEGTYRVTVDMNVTYDGGCSRLTGQRLLANDHAQYYGKEEYYIASVLDRLHPEEKSRTYAGYEEVNTNNTGEVGDMGNLSTLEVEVTIGKGEDLVLGVRTDNNKEAMNRSYEDNWWDCTGRYKIDNFRLYCVSIDATGISETTAQPRVTTGTYNLMGVKVGNTAAHGIYIKNGKKYVK